MLGSARTSGTQTGKQVAATMSEFAQRFTVASIDVTLAGVQAAGEYGARFAMLASGILSGVADALRPPASDGKEEATTASTPEQKSGPKES